MSEVSAWSVTASGNDSTAPDGFPEGILVSAFNDSAREVMAAMARWYQDTNASLSSGGSSNAYTLNCTRTVSAYGRGLVFAFLANHTNTGASTLNVDSNGARAIRKHGTQALDAGDIVSGALCFVVDDGTNFQLLNPQVGRVKVVTFTRDISVTGTQAITGAGFRPTEIEIKAAFSTPAKAWSDGYGDGTTYGALVGVSEVSSDSAILRTDAIIGINTASNATALAALTSLDADGATLTWTKVGSPTGTISAIVKFRR